MKRALGFGTALRGLRDGQDYGLMCLNARFFWKLHSYAFCPRSSLTDLADSRIDFSFN
jgi:hypothetical protein